MVSVEDEEPAMVVASLRKALAEIDELSAERASIEEALKEERNRDNILPKLMASSGRSDNIFTDELKKYDELKVGSKSSAASILTGVMNSEKMFLDTVCDEVNIGRKCIHFVLARKPAGQKMAAKMQCRVAYCKQSTYACSPGHIPDTPVSCLDLPLCKSDHVWSTGASGTALLSADASKQ